MNRLRELRKERGYSLKEVAKEIELAESQLSYYENGKRQPRDQETWQKLADFYNVSVPYVMGIDAQQINALQEGALDLILPTSFSNLLKKTEDNLEINKKIRFSIGFLVTNLSSLIDEGDQSKIDNFLDILDNLVSPNGVCSKRIFQTKQSNDEYLDVPMDTALDNFFSKKSDLENSIQKFFLSEFNERYKK